MCSEKDLVLIASIAAMILGTIVMRLKNRDDRDLAREAIKRGKRYRFMAHICRESQTLRRRTATENESRA